MENWDLLQKKLSDLKAKLPELEHQTYQTKPLIVYIILSRLSKIEHIRDFVLNLGIEEIDNNKILLRGIEK